jgi:pimeloyl-ACP methyl ester carboxylesterase
MPTIRVSDLDIDYRIDGDGDETLVLVNGLADTKESWAAQVPAFAERYRVVSYDNRGVGGTTVTPGPYTTAQMAADLHGLVDALGIDRFHLLGTSMGGMIAQEYAINHGADLKTAMFSSTYANPGPFCSRMFSMWHDMATITGVPFIMRDVTLWAFTQDFFWNREDELKEFEMEMADMPMSVEAYLAQLHVIQAHDTDDRLDRIQGYPVLVMAGEEDILIPVSLSKKLHEGLPKADWATSKGGHASMWEHPADFNRTYLGWLGEHR